MIIAVDNLSLAEFQQTEITADMAVISIGDPATTPPPLARVVPYLRAEFMDLNKAELSLYGYDEDCLPTLADIDPIIGFIKSLHQSDFKYRLVIHCRMGISRSAAVALIAEHLSGCGYPRKQDAFDANEHVLELAAKLTGLKILKPGTPVAHNSYCFKSKQLLI